MTEWPTLGWIDIAMLAVIGLSAIVGALRGLTFEILSLLGWVAAWFAGLWLGPMLAPHLPIGTAGSPLNGIAAFAAAFVIVLILCGLAARAVSALVGKTLLRPPDCSAQRSAFCAGCSCCSSPRSSSRTRRRRRPTPGASREVPSG
jgi:hypothetical protein